MKAPSNHAGFIHHPDKLPQDWEKHWGYRSLVVEGFEDVCKKLDQKQLRALRCARDPQTGLYVPPSDSTFYRVLNRVDPGKVENIVAGWLVEQEPEQLQRLALDGKALRGTGDHKKNHKPMMLLSVVTHQLKTSGSFPKAHQGGGACLRIADK